jgi:hypothetical protein
MSARNQQSEANGFVHGFISAQISVRASQLLQPSRGLSAILANFHVAFETEAELG